MRVSQQLRCVRQCSVADPHHIYADPDPDPACHFDEDPEPTFHFNADPDQEPSIQIKAQTLKKCSIRLIFLTFWLVICQLMRIRIQLITLMWTLILPLNLMRIHADPDPQQWCQLSELCGRQNDLLMKMRVLCNWIIGKVGVTASVSWLTVCCQGWGECFIRMSCRIDSRRPKQQFPRLVSCYTYVITINVPAVFIPCCSGWSDCLQPIIFVV
jgi:hypothetical protein